MENLKQPAYPTSDWDQTNDGLIVSKDHGGFTKLEKAALIIMAGMAASNFYVIGMHSEHPQMAITAVSLAAAVLEEANK